MKRFISLALLSLAIQSGVHAQDLQTSFEEVEKLLQAGQLGKARLLLDETRTSGATELESDSVRLFIISKLAFINGQLGDCERVLIEGEKEVELRSAMYGQADPGTLTAMHNQGVYSINCNRPEQAMEVLTNALQLHRDSIGKMDQILPLILDDLAYTKDWLGETEQSVTLYEELIELMGQHNIGGDFYYHVIDNYTAVLINDGEYEKAAAYYEVLNLHFKGSGGYAQFLRDFFSVFINIKDYSNAWSAGNDLLKLCIDDSCNELPLDGVRLNLARIGTVLGKTIRSLELYEEALPQYENEAEQYAVINMEMAQVAAKLGRGELQIRSLEQAVRVLKENDLLDSEYYPSAVFNLGSVYTYRGNSAPAEKIFEEYLSSLQAGKTTDALKMARANQALGNQKFLLQNFKDADYYFNNARMVLEEAGQRKNLVYPSVLNSLGALDEALSNYDRAETHYREALSLIRELESSEEKDKLLVAINANLANILLQVDPQNEALEDLFRESILLQQELYGLGHPAYANLLGNRGMYYQTTLRYEKAEQDYINALNVLKYSVSEDHPDYIVNTANLGLLYDILGREEESLELLTRAKALYEQYYSDSHPGYLLTINNLTNLYTGMGELEKAEPLMLELADKQVDQIRNSFTYLSENEKAKFVADKRQFLDNFKRFAIAFTDQGQDPSRASILTRWFDLEMSTKGILLNSTKKVRNQIFASGDVELIGLFTEWTLVRKNIAELQSLKSEMVDFNRSTIDSLNNYVVQLERDLGRKSSQFLSSFNTVATTFENVRDQLQEDEVAIEVIKVNLEGSAVYTALLVFPDAPHPELVVINEAEHLEERVFKLYQNSLSFSEKDRDSFEQYWRLLYDNFWKPLQTNLEGRKVANVYFSPDGIYHKVSLNTLYDSDRREYLLEQYNLVQLTSSKDLVSKRADGPPPDIADQRMLLIGRPKYSLSSVETSVNQVDTRSLDLANISDLPGTEEEIVSIGNLLSKEKINYRQMLHEDCTEEMIKSDLGYDVIHIATHGFFLDNGQEASGRQADPMLYSGLLLAGASDRRGTGEDGILTAFEIMNLEFSNNDLVILSACETGLGAVSEGEGIYGLQRAFFVAGTNTIVMSLWKVDDSATRDLMTNFYANYLKTRDKRASFRNAQKKILKQYEAPVYWGAFVMIGI